MSKRRYEADEDYEAYQVAKQSMLCSYRGRACHGHRAVKADGDLHSLCEYHRTRANACQSKHTKKQKLQQRADEASSMAPPHSGHVAPAGADWMGRTTHGAPQESSDQGRQCKYPKCEGLRVLKTSGVQLRLCEKHRHKATQHQAKYKSRHTYTPLTSSEATNMHPSAKIYVDALLGVETIAFNGYHAHDPQSAQAMMQRDPGRLPAADFRDDASDLSGCNSLAGDFDLLRDNVPEAAAAHVLFTELGPLDSSMAESLSDWGTSTIPVWQPSDASSDGSMDVHDRARLDKCHTLYPNGDVLERGRNERDEPLLADVDRVERSADHAGSGLYITGLTVWDPDVSATSTWDLFDRASRDDFEDFFRAYTNENE